MRNKTTRGEVGIRKKASAAYDRKLQEKQRSKDAAIDRKIEKDLLSMSKMGQLNRLNKLTQRREHILNTYSGCEWCCGGGDEELAELSKSIKILENANEHD